MKMMMLSAFAATILMFAGPAMAQIPGMPPIVLTDPGPEGVRIDLPGVFGNYFAASGPGAHPAVLVLGGSEGGLGPGATREARALAKEGFTVLQLAYFGAPGTPAALVSVPLETFAKGLAWLKAQPGVNAKQIGIVGGSKGAEAALLFATGEPSLRAVVVSMPSSVSWPGIAYTTQMQPSWTAGGKPLPYLPYATGANFRSILDLYSGGLKALDAHPEAVIPAERIKAPIMLVCGEADTLWPSCPMADQIAARLKAKGRPAPVLLHYSDAGHAVFGAPVDRSSPTFASLASLGGTAEGNAAAREDNWPKAVAFLKQALR